MVNGTAAANLLPVLDESAPVSTPSTSNPIEIAIGEVLIALADTSVRACREVQAGGRISPTTRSQGGDLIAELVLARAKVGENEFADTVRRVGRLRYHDAGLSEATADETISGILQIVGRVNAMMRAMAH
jgi:hypothetical protein